MRNVVPNPRYWVFLAAFLITMQRSPSSQRHVAAGQQRSFPAGPGDHPEREGSLLPLQHLQPRRLTRMSCRPMPAT